MSVIQIRWTAPDGVNYRGLFQDVLAMADFVQKHRIRDWIQVSIGDVGLISQFHKKDLTR